MYSYLFSDLPYTIARFLIVHYECAALISRVVDAMGLEPTTIQGQSLLDPLTT